MKFSSYGWIRTVYTRSGLLGIQETSYADPKPDPKNGLDDERVFNGLIGFR